MRVVCWLALVLVAAVGCAPTLKGPFDGDAKEVILRQLAAFRAGDFETAFLYASRLLRNQFTLEKFERMVKADYPQIAQSSHAWVLETRSVQRGIVHVQLRIRGADGTFVRATYEMVREDTYWRVNGVVARPDPNIL